MTTTATNSPNVTQIEMHGVPEGWSAKRLPLGEVVLTTPAARETSVCHDRGWVALITGTDPVKRYSRAFCGRRGEFRLPSDGVYEYRNICRGGQSNYSYTKHSGERGWFRLEETSLTEISEADVQAYLRQRLAPSIPPATPAETKIVAKIEKLGAECKIVGRTTEKRLLVTVVI